MRGGRAAGRAQVAGRSSGCADHCGWDTGRHRGRRGGAPGAATTSIGLSGSPPCASEERGQPRGPRSPVRKDRAVVPVRKPRGPRPPSDAPPSTGHGPRSPAEGAMTTLCGRCPAQGRPLLTEQGRARQAARGAGSPGAGKHVETREGCCRPCLGAEPPVSAPTGAVTRARAPPSRWVSGRYGRARWACSRPARCAKRVGPWGSRGWVCGGCGRWRLSNALSNRALGRWGRVGGWPAGGWAIPLVVRVWGEAEREGFEPSMEREPHTRLAGECLQPLGHLSRRSRW